MLNQNVNVIAYSGAHAPDVLQFPARRSDERANEKFDNGKQNGLSALYSKVSRFDFTKEDWEAGRTAMLYRKRVATTELVDRERLYLMILDDVTRGVTSSSSLLAFVIFEPHMRLVSRAVGDFLSNRNCNLDDEFEGVHQVVDVLGSDHTVNKGAVLAGLVALGDRRINAVARAARHLLSLDDIRSFSRYQINKMRSPSVEFCLDWLIELNQNRCQAAVSDLGCALMLMVFHDDQGYVEDFSEINYVGYKNTKILQSKTFESYYCEVLPILNYLKKCEGFETVIDMVINSWRDHEAKAKELRASVDNELYA